MDTTDHFKTKRERFWFVVASAWFLAWTVLYIFGGIFTPYGFKWVGWIWVAILPIPLVWGVVKLIKTVIGWIRQGE